MRSNDFWILLEDISLFCFLNQWRFASFTGVATNTMTSPRKTPMTAAANLQVQLCSVFEAQSQWFFVDISSKISNVIFKIAAGWWRYICKAIVELLCVNEEQKKIEKWITDIWSRHKVYEKQDTDDDSGLMKRTKHLPCSLLESFDSSNLSHCHIVSQSSRSCRRLGRRSANSDGYQYWHGSKRIRWPSSGPVGSIRKERRRKKASLCTPLPLWCSARETKSITA